MPGAKTHDIAYKQIKEKLNNKTLSNFPNYDDYNIFSQGHDLLIYYQYYYPWHLKKNIITSVKLQEEMLPEFVFNYMDIAKKNGALEEEATRLFIGAGYIFHHILDMYIHPLLIYYSKDHIPDKNNVTWQHGIIETLIDAYMVKSFENKNPATYKIYEDFKFKKQVSQRFVDTLNKSFEKTYDMVNIGNKFKISFYQTQSYIKAVKYDPKRIKKKIFDYLDKYFMGTSSFSYHVNPLEALKYLNIENKFWNNPVDSTLTSTESFMDLYDKALKESSYIIDKLEELAYKGIFNRDDIYSIIPNKSSISGL